MKILTINIHSHYPDMDKQAFTENAEVFAEYVANQKIDLFAVQECGQTRDADMISPDERPAGMFAGEQTELRADNYALKIAEALSRRGENFYWTWCSVKLGYGMFDEGLAVFSRYPILAAEEFYTSRSQAFENWKVRKLLGIKVKVHGTLMWAYSVHMGWWNDEEEKFLYQLEQINKHLPEERKEQIFLMGDFNSRADIRQEGYDAVKEQGWLDTYELANEKDAGITVRGKIDGWDKEKAEGMRIDYIWTDRACPVHSSQVVFDGHNGPVISDHFGVLVSADLT